MTTTITPTSGAAYAARPDEREAFEAMMRSQTFDNLKRLSDGSYESYEARVGWLAWNVRASHGQAPTSSAVLKAIREANMQLVRTGDDAFMLVPYKVATAQAAASVLEAAARYHYLRNKSQVVHNNAWFGGMSVRNHYGDFLCRDDALAALDTAIDVARKQGANHD